jgi:hypothetical protein
MTSTRHNLCSVFDKSSFDHLIPSALAGKPEFKCITGPATLEEFARDSRIWVHLRIGNDNTNKLDKDYHPNQSLSSVPFNSLLLQGSECTN